MAVKGNVYVRPGLSVTALRTGSGDHRLEVSQGDGKVSEYALTLTAGEVRDLHRELGVWLDAVDQAQAPKVTVIAFAKSGCPVCGQRACEGHLTGAA